MLCVKPVFICLCSVMSRVDIVVVVVVVVVAHTGESRTRFCAVVSFAVEGRWACAACVVAAYLGFRKLSGDVVILIVCVLRLTGHAPSVSSCARCRPTSKLIEPHAPAHCRQTASRALLRLEWQRRPAAAVLGAEVPRRPAASC